MKLKKENIEWHVVVITPALAKLWLQTRKKQRNIYARHIQNLAHKMAIGDWQDLNGDTIVFDRNGNLIDGQHRLYAVIESNIHITSGVLLGVEPTRIFSIDSGNKNRGFKDLLEITGTKENSALIATALKYLYYYRKKVARASNNYQIIPSTQELNNLWEKNRTIQNSIPHALPTKGLLPPSFSIFLHYVCSEIDQKTADDFFHRLSFGTGKDDRHKGCPIAALRRQLLDSLLSRQRKLTLTQKMAITIIAWNNYREGNNTKILRYISRGPRKQKFPWPK